jgi:SAM-dependent methyltransferase
MEIEPKLTKDKISMYLQHNALVWDELTQIHFEPNKHYRLKEVISGGSSLSQLEVNEIGTVRGATLLHLHCHFGLDTLSWARLGAKCTGVDISQISIETARRLSDEIEIPTEFLCCDACDLPESLNNQFDIVCATYGVFIWIHNIESWMNGCLKALKPRGILYICDGHPHSMILKEDALYRKFTVAKSYFRDSGPYLAENKYDYAKPEIVLSRRPYIWWHTLSNIVNTAIKVGFELEYIHEHEIAVEQYYSLMERTRDEFWRLPTNIPSFPLMFSMKARKS